MEEVLGVIPARGGSKGIPHKNMIDLCGSPLIKYTFDAAKDAKKLSRVVVSTEDEKIKEYSEKENIEVVKRPLELAGDEAETADVLLHVLKYLEEKEGYIPQYTMILQPTSPLRTAEDIDKCIELIITEDADSVVSVVQTPHNCIPEKLMELQSERLIFLRHDGERYTTRQKQRELYSRNGAAIYLFKTEMFKQLRSYYGNDCVPYIMNQNDSLDIDTFDDLELVKAWMQYKNPRH